MSPDSICQGYIRHLRDLIVTAFSSSSKPLGNFGVIFLPSRPGAEYKLPVSVDVNSIWGLLRRSPPQIDNNLPFSSVSNPAWYTSIHSLASGILPFSHDLSKPAESSPESTQLQRIACDGPKQECFPIERCTLRTTQPAKPKPIFFNVIQNDNLTH